MDFQLKVKANDKIFLRDPEGSDLGRKILRESIVMINELGFEHFTFKKLALQIDTTEAGIYRYFENKHKLLVYLITWYWGVMEYLVLFHINNISNTEKKIKKVIDLLSKEIVDNVIDDSIDRLAFYQIVVAESNKVYLTKEVELYNKDQIFKPYKDLCKRIAFLFSEYNSKYKFPHSLASTLLEMSHSQYFFMKNLPSLTDFGKEKTNDKLVDFLNVLVFSNLKK